MQAFAARYPYAAPVTAYGDGGFRFAEMSHKGSILCLPNGIWAWPAESAADLVTDDFKLVFESLPPPGVLLLGTGETQIFPSGSLVKAFTERKLGLEAMSTGAAARTYNLLLAEKRLVAAALIAVP